MLKSYLKTFYIKEILGKQIPISLIGNKKVAILNAQLLPLNKVYCVLNFDDLSPIPDNSRYIGRGGNPNDFVSVKQMELLKLYPFLGITHFMVPQFIPTDYYYIFDPNRYSISNPINKEWIEYYKLLGKNYNIEFSSHGVYHRQFENLLFSRHTEFAYLNFKQSLNKIRESINCFHKVGISPYGFRAPGWDMNSDLSLIDAIATSGLKYAGLSSYDGGLNSTIQRISYYHPVFINGIINFPDNINLDWPLNRIKMTIRKIVNLKGIISIKGHFSKHILPNSFSEENIKKLIETIKFIISEYKQKVQFATFKDVYERLAKSDFFNNNFINRNDYSN
jgi:hypothetical protein